MSIEQKIQEILAEQDSKTTDEVVVVEEETIDDGVTKKDGDNPDNARNNVEKQEIGGKEKTSNVVTKDASAPEPRPSIKEDVAALIDGEDLTEEFKEKAATIFEAAVLSRVKDEVAKLDDAYEAKLAEQVELVKEGLVEKVDGYLDYIVEQWIEQNEIALEEGMKSEILEDFIGGLKNLFEEHYIDIPEEKYDIVGELQEQVQGLTEKLDEQVASNVKLNTALNEFQSKVIVEQIAEGLVDTDKEKFQTLVEELEFDDLDTFAKKVKIIRESYFKNSNKTSSQSVVTDAPPVLNESAAPQYVEPQIKSYVNILNNFK